MNRTYKFMVCRFNVVIGLIITFVFSSLYFIDNNKSINNFNNDNEVNNNDDVDNIEKCISFDVVKPQIDILASDLIALLNSEYNMSFLYKNITDDYTFSYDDDKIHYAASTIKLLPVLYLYEKAMNNEVDLNDSLVYMNEDYTIKELIELSISISHNGAYLTLLEYIDIDVLRNYANSLGATNAYTTGDYYANITLNDAIIYLEKLNQFLSLENDYSNELLSFFPTEFFNYYFSSDALSIIKYGLYNEFYNDLAIIYEEIPYYLVILSFHGDDYEKVIPEIHELFYQFNQTYTEITYNVCS